MFKFVRAIVKKIMDSKSSFCENPTPMFNATNATIRASDPASEPIEDPLMDIVVKTIDMDSISVNVPTIDDFDTFEYEPEMDVITRWKTAARNDSRPLIAMIRQLYFFSDHRKTTIRKYTTCKEEIPKFIGKIKRRPELQIDVSDMNVFDHPQMFNMYRRLSHMVGMFRINDFMVRVEHAFDNSQIESEHFVVSQIMQPDHKLALVHGCGIDHAHHIIIPVHVHLNSICKIPASERTLFHHISYSIQPVLTHSRTLDTWFKTVFIPPTTAQIMRLCIQMAEALTYLHAHNIVHGDIKPGNTLIRNVSWEPDSNSSGEETLYLIDFGMSGSPGAGDGTGGTKPFCAPETGNGFNPNIDMDTYTWTKIQKHHDVWSSALMFFTLIVLRKSTAYPKDYPSDFFDVNRDGHVNPEYFDKIPDEPMRELFRRALCPAENRMSAAEFLTAATAAAVANATVDSSVSVASDATVASDDAAKPIDIN
jgi:hypothetical protein